MIIDLGTLLDRVGVLKVERLIVVHNEKRRKGWMLCIMGRKGKDGHGLASG